MILRKKNEIVSIVQDAKKIDSDLLPKKGAFLELSNKVISEYILFLSKQLIKVEVEEFFENGTITVKQSQFQKYFSSSNEEVISYGNLKLEDVKMTCSYEIDNGKRMIA